MQKKVLLPSAKTETIRSTKEKKRKKIVSKKKSGDKKYVKIRLYDDHLFELQARRVSVAADQILGTRKTQQDCFDISDDAIGLSTDKTRAWAVVCDGMGGMASGELASKTTTDIMSQILKSALPGDSICDILMQGIAIANDEVKKISQDLDGTSGTTMICAVTDNNNLHYASVGDSRIYIYRNDEFLQITRDHNYFLELKEMVKNGEITYEEALLDPQKEALISFIGIDSLDVIDINREPLTLKHNDIILLCSDGLTKVLTDSEIMEIIKSGNYDLREILNTLLLTVQMGNAKSLDNTTIALMHYSETD